MIEPEYNLPVNQVTQRLTNDFANSSARTLRLAGKNFQHIVELFLQKATNAAEIARVNAGIAATMRDAVVEAYQTNVVAVRSAPSYSRKDRLAGRILDALSDPSMAVGTENGISFVNTALLNSTARFWGRLNFGATPEIGYRHRSFPVEAARIRFGSNQGESLRLGGFVGSAFRVPQKGIGFFEPSGKLNLKSINGSRGPRLREKMVRAVPSEGIVGRHFLERGLNALGENFGPAYRVHFKEAEREAAASQEKTTVISEL